MDLTAINQQLKTRTARKQQADTPKTLASDVSAVIRLIKQTTQQVARVHARLQNRK
jgi:hypothetical protein